MKPARRLDSPLLGRFYCGFVALLLIGLGASAWSADRQANLYLGAMLCGTGLFMLAGLFGSATRVLAILALCAVYATLAFALSVGLLVLHRETPSAGQVTVWGLEIAAGGIAAVLARELYRDIAR